MTDLDYFIEHYKEIFDEYGPCFVVLKNQRIINTYPTFSEAYHETIKNEKLGTFSILECNGDESGYTTTIATPDIIVLSDYKAKKVTI